MFLRSHNRFKNKFAGKKVQAIPKTWKVLEHLAVRIRNLLLNNKMVFIKL